MRKIITLAAIVAVAAVVLAWSLYQPPKAGGGVAATAASATISPMEITAKNGKTLPVERWDAF